MMNEELPHPHRFDVRGIYLNSAYTHPMSNASVEAVSRYLVSRTCSGLAEHYSMQADREHTKQLFARLINCNDEELAWIPSTMVGENLVCSGLRLVSRRAHVVTDAAHFEGSLYLYEQLRQQGAEVTVVPMVDGRITLAQLEAAIRPDTALVALSLVSALTGFEHDLKAVCELAHSRGALVYADIIQAAGAMPIDVRESGVDFCACSTYKWLMGDFGVGFFYVRADRMDRLVGSQSGYRQLASFGTRFLPFEGDGSAIFSFAKGTGAAALFEVGTLGSGAVAALKVSLEYLLQTGVANIQAHRAAMIARLQAVMPSFGFIPLTPINSQGPIVCFARKNALALQPTLEAAGINIQLYPHRLRISPSVFNSMADIDRLVEILAKPQHKD